MFEASLGQLGEGGMVAAILTIVLCKEAFHSRLFIFCILYAVDFLYLMFYMQQTFYILYFDHCAMQGDIPQQTKGLKTGKINQQNYASSAELTNQATAVKIGTSSFQITLKQFCSLLPHLDSCEATFSCGQWLLQTDSECCI